LKAKILGNRLALKAKIRKDFAFKIEIRPGHENGTLMEDQTAQASSCRPGQAPGGFWAAPVRL
jgi:hypothetical protein